MARRLGIQKMLSVVVMSLSCSDAFLFTNNGEVGPVNPYGFVNETLRLTCNVTKDSFLGNISEALFFKLTHQNKVDVLPLRYVTPISDRAVQLDYPLKSQRDQGQYTCMLNTTFIGEQRVHVEFSPDRPRKVGEIDCRVFDWRNMTCTWDLGVNYINTDMVKSELYWEIIGGTNRCPHPRETTCIWQEIEKGNRVDFFKPDQNYSMHVNVTVHTKERKEPPLDTVASDVFFINPRNLVEPAPVHSLTVWNRTSRCLSLLWNHGQHMRPMMYTMNVLQQQFNTSEREITVCDLHPAMSYTLKVRCIPLRYGSDEPTGFYSSWTSIEAKTLEDVPSGVPEVKTGSFVYDCETSQCTATIYWRPIPFMESNGKITRYTIKQENRQDGTTKVMKVAGSATSHDLKVSGDEEYSITLTGETRVGVSGQSKRIVIPAYSKVPHPSDIVVEADSSTLYITWGVPTGSSDPHNGSITGYTLYYCNGSKINSKCEDSIHWLSFASNIRRYEWNVPDGDLDNKMIGVSVEEEIANRNVSSGIKWNTCVWRRNHKPPSPRGMTFSRHQPDNALSLEWQRFACAATPVYVLRYVVSHCPANHDGCAGPSVIANVSNTEESHVIQGLSAGVKYRVTLRAVSRAGEGPESDPISKLVVNSDLTSTQIASISAGGVFGCVMLISFVVCCLRKLRKTYRGIPLDIKLPKLTGVDKNDEHKTREAVTKETKDNILEKGIPQTYSSSVDQKKDNKELILKREDGVTPRTILGSDEKLRTNLETAQLEKHGNTSCSDRDKDKTAMNNKAGVSSDMLGNNLKLALSSNSDSTKQGSGSDNVTKDKLSLLMAKSSSEAVVDKSSGSSGQDTASSPPPPYEPPDDQKLETPPPTYSSHVSPQTDLPADPKERQMSSFPVGDNSSSSNSHPLSVLLELLHPSSSPCGDTSHIQTHSREESTDLQDHVTPKLQSHCADSPYIPFDKIQPPQPLPTPQPPGELKTVPPPADGYVSVSEASEMTNKHGFEKTKENQKHINIPCSGESTDSDKTRSPHSGSTDPSSIQVDSYLRLALSGTSNATKQESGSDYVTKDKLSLLLAKSSSDASLDKSSCSSGQDTASSPPPPYEPPDDQKLETPPPTYSSYVSSQTDLPADPKERQMSSFPMGENSSSSNSHPLSVLLELQHPPSSPCGDTSHIQTHSREESTDLQDHVTPKPQSHCADSPYIPFDKIQPPQPLPTPQPPGELKTVPPPADGYVSVSEASEMTNKHGFEKTKENQKHINIPCSGESTDSDKTRSPHSGSTDPSSIQVDSYLKLDLSGTSNVTKQESGSDYVTNDKLSLLLSKSSSDASLDKSSGSSGQDTASSPPPPYEPPDDQKLASSYVSSQTSHFLMSPQARTPLDVV